MSVSVQCRGAAAPTNTDSGRLAERSRLGTLSRMERIQRRILIAEDDQTIREILAALLDEEGYATTSVSNGREAIDWRHR